MSHPCPAVDGSCLRTRGDVDRSTELGRDSPITRGEDPTCVDLVRDLRNGDELRRMRRELFARRDLVCESSDVRRDDRPPIEAAKRSRIEIP